MIKENLPPSQIPGKGMKMGRREEIKPQQLRKGSWNYIS
jgi:hypothetical protein